MRDEAANRKCSGGRRELALHGAQVLGGSFGPFFASLLVSDADARGAILFGGACLVIAVVLAFGLHQFKARKGVAP